MATKCRCKGIVCPNIFYVPEIHCFRMSGHPCCWIILWAHRMITHSIAMLAWLLAMVAETSYLASSDNNKVLRTEVFAVWTSPYLCLLCSTIQTLSANIISNREGAQGHLQMICTPRLSAARKKRWQGGRNFPGAGPQPKNTQQPTLYDDNIAALLFVAELWGQYQPCLSWPLHIVWLVWPSFPPFMFWEHKQSDGWTRVATVTSEISFNARTPQEVHHRSSSDSCARATVAPCQSAAWEWLRACVLRYQNKWIKQGTFFYNANIHSAALADIRVFGRRASQTQQPRS